MYGTATYATALMCPMHCGAAIAVQNGGLVVGSATNVMARAYIFLYRGCAADGYVKHVNALRMSGAITIIVENSASSWYKVL